MNEFWFGAIIVASLSVYIAIGIFVDALFDGPDDLDPVCVLFWPVLIVGWVFMNIIFKGPKKLAEWILNKKKK